MQSWEILSQKSKASCRCYNKVKGSFIGIKWNNSFVMFLFTCKGGKRALSRPWPFLSLSKGPWVGNKRDFWPNQNF